MKRDDTIRLSFSNPKFLEVSWRQMDVADAATRLQPVRSLVRSAMGQSGPQNHGKNLGPCNSHSHDGWLKSHKYGDIGDGLLLSLQHFFNFW